MARNHRTPPPTTNPVALLRRKLKMTQPQFAHELGVERVEVSRWENGHRKPLRGFLLQMGRMIGGIRPDQREKLEEAFESSGFRVSPKPFRKENEKP